MVGSYVIATFMILRLLRGICFIGLIVVWLYFIIDPTLYGTAAVWRKSGSVARNRVPTLSDRFTPVCWSSARRGLVLPAVITDCHSPAVSVVLKTVRTAWAVKGLIHLSPHNQSLNALCEAYAVVISAHDAPLVCARIAGS